MEKEGGNRERMRKCRESISLHFLIFSPFPPHFLILSPFPLRFLFISSFSLHFLAARLQGCNRLRNPAAEDAYTSKKNISFWMSQTSLVGKDEWLIWIAAKSICHGDVYSGRRPLSLLWPRPLTFCGPDLMRALHLPSMLK